MAPTEGFSCEATEHFFLWYQFATVAGLLGAAPTLPLLANPALSAALLQMLLQNQAKAQQVTLPICSLLFWFLDCCSYPTLAFLFLSFFFFLNTIFSSPSTFLSLLHISKPCWGIIFSGLRCYTMKIFQWRVCVWCCCVWVAFFSEFDS